MSYAAPLAAQLGMSIEETTALMGALAKNTFTGERAGTALRNVFSEMLDPASEFSKALRDLGIDSTNFGDVLEGLVASGDAGRDAILKLDAQARPAILALVNDGGAALRELQSALADSEGAAARTAAEMKDNLGGAAESVTDSFDRVRRSLVDPLLEPLKVELASLSDELETFAASPEFNEIKGALKELFVEGAAAARDLIENVDFGELAKNIKTFLGDAGASISEFKDNIGGIVNTVVTVGRAFDLVFNAIQAVIFGLAAAITKIVAVVAQFADSFTEPQLRVLRFLGVLDEGEGSITNFAGGINAVAEEFRARFTKNVGEAADAAVALANATEESGGAAEAGLGKVASAATAAGEATAALGEASTQTTEALKGQAQGAVDSATATASAAGQIESSADRLKKAFADMGISSERELRRAADSAKRNFDLIREAVSKGEATAQDARAAFAKYAEAARAAVANADESAKASVEGQLRVQAAVLGVTDALDAAGTSGLRAGDNISAGANKAAAALTQVDASAQGAAENTKKAGEEIDHASAFMGDASKEGEKFALSNYAVSDSAIAAYLNLNKWASTSRLWINQINSLTFAVNAQGKALNDEVRILEEANAEFDEFAKRRKELSQKYDKLGSTEIEKLVQAEAQLEQNRKRAADERKRAAAEAVSNQTPAEAVQIARRVQEESAAAASVVGDVLERVRTAATAMDSASNRMASTKLGEIVLRIISEAAPGAQAFKLSEAQMREIAAAFMRALQQSKRSSG